MAGQLWYKEDGYGICKYISGVCYCSYSDDSAVESVNGRTCGGKRCNFPEWNGIWLHNVRGIF